MQAIIIIVAIVLLLKFLATSHKAAAVAIKTSCISTASGGAGDSFFGNTTVAGVCEPHPSLPPTTIHCCHIVAHFPVDPPPIAIQKPIPIVMPKPLPGPMPYHRPGVDTCGAGFLAQQRPISPYRLRYL